MINLYMLMYISIMHSAFFSAVGIGKFKALLTFSHAAIFSTNTFLLMLS